MFSFLLLMRAVTCEYFGLAHLLNENNVKSLISSQCDTNTSTCGHTCRDQLMSPLHYQSFSYILDIIHLNGSQNSS